MKKLHYNFIFFLIIIKLRNVVCQSETEPILSIFEEPNPRTSEFSDWINESTEVQTPKPTPRTVFVDSTFYGGLLVDKDERQMAMLKNRTRVALSKSVPVKKLNLPRGMLFRVATLMEPPFVTYANLSDEMRQEQKSGPGVVMDILIALQKLHKFNYDFYQPQDNVWGEPTGPDEDTWTGMFGMLQRQEVELIAASTVLRYDRHAVADYTYPFHASETGMLIRSPERYTDNRFLIVTAPFKWQVWAITALAIVVSGGIMKALSRALQCAAEIEYSVWEATWVFFSVFVQQGLPTQPKSWTCRSLLAFWWLAALTLVATFTGNMVALFAVNRSYLPFNSQEEMVEHVRSAYKVIMVNNSLTRLKFIQNSKQVLYRDLWYEMNTNGKWINVSTYDEGVELVKQRPNMVLLGPKETLQAYVAKDCNVTITSGGLIPVMYSIALKKDSNYTELFSHEIRDLVEMGFVTKWLKDYEYEMTNERGNRCSSGEGVTNAGDAIDIIRAQGAFWILLAGIAMAIIGFIFEYLIRLIKNIISSAKIFINTAEGKKSDQCDIDKHDAKYKQIYNYSMTEESSRCYQPSFGIALPGNEDEEGKLHQLKLRKHNHVTILRF